jgi:type IV secretion system protein VirB10
MNDDNDFQDGPEGEPFDPLDESRSDPAGTDGSEDTSTLGESFDPFDENGSDPSGADGSEGTGDSGAGMTLDDFMIDEEALANYDINEENVVQTIADPFDDSAGAFPDTENNIPDESQNKSAATELPADNGKDTGGETPPVFDTQHQEQPDPEPFVPGEKAPPSNFIQSKPKKLNKQLVLYLIGGVFICFIVFTTFIIPLFNFGNTKKNEEKPKAETPGRRTDYYALVPREEDPIYAYDDGELFLDDDDLPPVINPAYHYREPEQPQTAPAASGGGGGSGSTRPDTRNDRLQGKSISGIKGITPSQQRYLDENNPYAPYMQNSGLIPDPTNPYAQFGMPAKDEYTNQLLQYQGGQAQNTAMSSYDRQNDQGGKLNFYNQGRENAGNGYWLNPASIWPGTIFDATLTSNINTDLPGECTAMVTKNVYSSVDGKLLLIPMNSRLLGSYNSSISYAQSRVQVGWHTLIRPDGYYINLGNMQATDTRGAAGLPGLINDHPFQYLKAIALLSAMNIVNSELSNSAATANNQYVQNVMANTQEVATIFGGKLIDRALDVQPTITIKAGTAINIVVNTNLVLPPMEPYPVKYPYHRGE